MTDTEVWVALARECPRRIMSELHACGEYHHGTCARFPGKVLCCHRNSELPDGWKPTPAQELARQKAEPGSSDARLRAVAVA
jgi:hypothetical protein